ncbi:T9SS type A sorting domain-containing protein [Tamlana agarivorans]|uniref:T9SS type A sorting domain-containing protein n=1 Tax=Pseudotamlana agarivorans TaxID=481183 RepID=A0ACC5U597_9FLAO|nr:putative glycoside hydrolase [Tamlana agarivorans]MBU2949433.1 T9SS type A sorting domain-containing protein [Tamlana agarivorans]
MMKFKTAFTLLLAFAATINTYAQPAKPGDWSKIRLYGHAFKNEDFTNDQYDFIIDNFGIFTVEKRHARDIYGATNTEDAAEATAQRIHAGNPDCKVLMYWSTNTAYTQYYTTVDDAITTNPDWVDPSNSRYTYPDDCKDWWVSKANEIVTTRGLDGIFGDGAPGAQSRGYIDDVNDNLGALSALSCFNLYNGYRVATASKIYAGDTTLANADGVMCEAFFRIPVDTKEEAVFQMDEFLAIPSDKYIICRGAAGAFGSTHEFTLACCLILANDYTYYSWGGDGNSYAGDGTMTYWHSDFEQEIGEPLGKATKNGYVYSRVFENCTVTVDFENATSSIVWNQNNASLSTAEKKKVEAYTIYPNPTHDKIHIISNKNNSKNSSITIINLEGKILNTISFNSLDNMKVNISHLNKGFYFLKIQTENGNSIHKIIKK